MSEQHPDTTPTEDNPFFWLDGQQYLRLYYFMPEKHLLDLIINDEIKVSIPDECNDPLEFLPAGNNESINKEQRDCGLISFSSHFGSSLMWAHYADSHRGVCIQFDFPIKRSGRIDLEATENFAFFPLEGDNANQIQSIHKGTRFAILDSYNIDLKQFESIVYNNENLAFLIEVNYAKERPKRPRINMSYYASKEGLISFGVAKDFYTKSEEWAYEKEWRLLANLEETKGFHDKAFFIKGLSKHISMVIIGKKFPIRASIMEHFVNQAFKAQETKQGLTPTPHSIPVCQADYHDKKYKIILQ